MKIMVVEDSEYARKSLRNIFESVNIDVVEVEDPLKAIEVYKKENPDIVTLDITMPEKDGTEVLKDILDADPYAKVIMITSNGQESSISKTILMGAAHYVSKPFNPSKVLRVIEKVQNS